MELDRQKFELEYIEDENGTIYINYNNLQDLLAVVIDEIDDEDAGAGLVAVADFLEEMRKKLMSESVPPNTSHH